MPDLERIYRKLNEDLASNKQDLREIRSYHRGQDSARIEIVLLVAVIVLFIACFAA